MIKTLRPSELTVTIDSKIFDFSNTQSLVDEAKQSNWIAQTEARKAAEFGLEIKQQGFNLLVLGLAGSGRATLMKSAMLAKAAQSQVALTDLVALCGFERGESPLFVRLPAGNGNLLKTLQDQLLRNFVQTFNHFFVKLDVDPTAVKDVLLEKTQEFVRKHLDAIRQQISVVHPYAQIFANYLANYEQDFNNAIESWQPRLEDENPFENFINESWLNRYRVNVLVDQHDTTGAPVIYDNNPSIQTLFGCVDGHADSASLPEFMRLRAGNVLKADGGMLMLHLRDLLYDHQEGSALLEKLHRFLRNGTLMIEEAGGGQSHSTSYAIQTPLAADVKLVLLATREEYYQTLDDLPEFFDFFPIKVEFADRMSVDAESLQDVALLVASFCEQHSCPHVSAEAVAALIQWMLRLEEDQQYIGTQFSILERMLLQSAVFAQQRQAKNIEFSDVQQAIAAQEARSRYVESQVRQSIFDREVLMQVHGEVIGQVNGLTHTELGEASFGTPVRISARCYAGRKGIVHIDREVNMSGAHHDKGLLILQGWLNACFASIAPLSLSASLVFEQEYSMVDGDSASCAELFSLLSALSGKPIRQGIAVTGALNQHGEVLPIGGLNEKIEGYFRVCEVLGLDGKQGVLIPARNQRHLMLSEPLIKAVASGKFNIWTMETVEDGMGLLMGSIFGQLDSDGHYTKDSIMGLVEQALSRFNLQVANRHHG